MTKNNIFLNLKKKIFNMSKQEILTLSLWLLTFILLLVFVILAATLNQSEVVSKTVDLKSITKLSVAKPEGIKVGDMTSVAEFAKSAKIPADSNGLFVWTITVPSHILKESKNLASYANALGSVGFIFALSMFASLLTTVIFAEIKRRGGK